MNQLLVFSIFILCSSSLIAQVDIDSPLYKELEKQDSIFFERGFNLCDLVYLEQHISDDLIFYHDQGGVQDRAEFLENTQQFICGDGVQKPIRKLEKGSLEVFPLYNNGVLYGVIQSGIHHFYLREEGKEDVHTSTAKFTSVWLKNGDDWIVSNVLSYDHQNPDSKVKEYSSIEQLLEENRVPALGIGVIENGELTKVKVYGSLDLKTTAPHNTIFKVASLTKPIVALITLKLIDKGLLDLDEPLSKYWIDPDLIEDERYKKISPRLVLTHRTGLPNWRYLSESNKLTFQFDPGTSYKYSGEGFEYLRKAIENKLGKSIEELANEFLFEPLDMKDTRFWWDAEMNESRYAQNFDKNGNVISLNKYYEANAAANLLTTVEDYGRFLEYVINGAGLSDSLFEEMQKQHVELGDNDFFGLGWEILTGFSGDEFALIHTGKDPGVSTLAIIFPQSKNGYLIFMNGDNVDAVYEYLLLNGMYLGEELWDKR